MSITTVLSVKVTLFCCEKNSDMNVSALKDRIDKVVKRSNLPPTHWPSGQLMRLYLDSLKY